MIRSDKSAKLSRQLISFEAGSARLLILISAGAAFLALAALIFYQSAVHISGDWQAKISNQATVQIEAGENQKQYTNVVLNILESKPGVVDIQQIDETAVRELLKPFLGAVDLGLPLPVLIKLELDPETDFNAESIVSEFDDLGLNAQIDMHQSWQSAAYRLGRIAQTGALFVLICIAVVMAAMVVFVSRASLMSQAQIIEILRVIGAEDRSISRMFERRFFGFGFLGGSLGLGFILICIFFLQSGLNSSFEIGPRGWEWLIILLMPLLLALFIGLVARISILIHLRS